MSPHTFGRDLRGRDTHPSVLSRKARRGMGGMGEERHIQREEGLIQKERGADHLS
jgi:hypothetical protein